MVKYRLIRGTPTNSLVFLNASSRCEMSRSDSWEREWVVVQSAGQHGVQEESFWITRPQRLVHRHWCFQDEQARYVFRRSWKCSCTDTSRRQAKWFCRWIVVFVMCAHKTSYVYSHECVKSSCFDENLVRYLHIRIFWTVSQEYRHNDGHDMLSCDFSVQTCGNTSAHA